MSEPKFINAEQFVTKYGNWYTEEETENGFIGTVKDLVEQMPAADVAPRWIPVTERLPEESGEYLVAIGSMLYFSWFYKNDSVWSFMNADITAWMPLPEPYKAESEDKE